MSMKRFKAVQTFEVKDLGVYVEGHNYRIVDGNDMLDQLVSEWASKGKVVRLKETDAKPVAIATGIGVVTKKK
jgi:hypothetical protein